MRRKILLLPLLLCIITVSAETSLKIVPLTGNDMQYAVSLIGKIRFIDNVMFLYDKSDNVLGKTNVSDIGKIIFSEGDDTSIANHSSNSVQIYPNPASESIIVSGLTTNCDIRLYNLSGQLIKIISNDKAETQICIPVNDINNGTYLLQVGAEIVKFIKQ